MTPFTDTQAALEEAEFLAAEMGKIQLLVWDSVKKQLFVKEENEEVIVGIVLERVLAP